MRPLIFLFCFGFLGFLAAQATRAHAAGPRNVILFVADGLRSGIVSLETAPAMAEVRDKGVDFANPHSMVPTFTMPNAAAFATGHHIGDTGVFGNTMYLPAPLQLPSGLSTRTPFIENDTILRAIQAEPQYHGNFLNAETLLAMARRAGFATAALGKLGPVGLQDTTLLEPQAELYEESFMFDDSSGKKSGLPIPKELHEVIKTLTGQAAQVPDRGESARGGSCQQPGTLTANDVQGQWFTDVATKVLLPRFREAGKPFFMVFWSRDPDGTQHNHGDSFGAHVPGINGPTSLKAVRNADDSLRELRSALRVLGLEASTDIIVAADHGFSTISKQSRTSPSAVFRCADHDHMLPQGFLAMDLARALDLPLADPDSGYAATSSSPNGLSRQGHGVLGKDPRNPEVVVIANGGSDLIYLPTASRRALARKIVAFLLTQDYVSGLFVDDPFGPIPGTLPMSAINLKGGAQMTQPAILVNFASSSSDCGRAPILCAVTVADTAMQQGQGQHGSLSRADTANFMAAIGPSFKSGFRDLAPSSNADVGATIAQLLGLSIDKGGRLTGRVLREALVGGEAVKFASKTMVSPPAAGGLATVLNYQQVGSLRYIDAAGFPGRTVGLTPPTAAH
ncbi:MAG: alkaline phosphatase family protein [Rhodospirillaceae bacterium]|nr:alkaline phosphatase family protein [Rhodospirillaceae bacterium]